MALFFNLEYTDIVLVWDEVWGNGACAQRIFSGNLPNRLPDVRAFKNVAQRLREYGCFLNLELRIGVDYVVIQLLILKRLFWRVEARPGSGTHH